MVVGPHRFGADQRDAQLRRRRGLRSAQRKARAEREAGGEIRNRDMRQQLEPLAQRVSFTWIRAAVKKVLTDPAVIAEGDRTQRYVGFEDGDEAGFARFDIVTVKVTRMRRV